jgi:Spy/CpxP family protein refolding chaperone
MGPPPGGPPGQGPGRPGGPGGDPMMENFFPPEMVMRNQKAIALTTEQQAAIRSEMQKSIAQFTDLRWQQSAEEEAMAALVKQEHPDEKQVLAQLDKLLKIESEVKRLNLASMIRIKNILTPEQQAKLREMQKERRDFRRGPPQGQGGPEDSHEEPPPRETGNR